MGRYLRWSIIAANEDQQLAGRRHASRKSSEQLLAKVTEAHSVSKTQPQGLWTAC